MSSSLYAPPTFFSYRILISVPASECPSVSRQRHALRILQIDPRVAPDPPRLCAPRTLVYAFFQRALTPLFLRTHSLHRTSNAICLPNRGLGLRTQCSERRRAGLILELMFYVSLVRCIRMAPRESREVGNVWTWAQWAAFIRLAATQRREQRSGVLVVKLEVFSLFSSVS